MLTLSADELRELTTKRRHDAQRRVLEQMGMPFGERPDGSLVVLRAVVERMLGGGSIVVREEEPQVMP